ncbi:1,4-dihydroxy-2-naphthoate octaprenyltransferase, partial [Bifidobacterium animalis subsp. lactis]
GYGAGLGEIALILLTVVVDFNVAKREYRSAMRNLAWIALAGALVCVGLTMSI